MKRVDNYLNKMGVNFCGYRIYETHMLIRDCRKKKIKSKIKYFEDVIEMDINNKGFTLVELIVTIALLAVISIVSFVSINGVINQSKINNCESIEMDIKTAAKEYVSDNRYENSFDSDGDMIEIIDVKLLIDGHYLSGDVVNPFDNTKNIDASKIGVKIGLKDDYSAGDVSIYKKGDNSGYSCNKEWWNFG